MTKKNQSHAFQKSGYIKIRIVSELHSNTEHANVKFIVYQYKNLNKSLSIYICVSIPAMMGIPGIPSKIGDLFSLMKTGWLHLLYRCNL